MKIVMHNDKTQIENVNCYINNMVQCIVMSSVHTKVLLRIDLSSTVQ